MRLSNVKMSQELLSGAMLSYLAGLRLAKQKLEDEGLLSPKAAELLDVWTEYCGAALQSPPPGMAQLEGGNPPMQPPGGPYSVTTKEIMYCQELLPDGNVCGKQCRGQQGLDRHKFTAHTEEGRRQMQLARSGKATNKQGRYATVLEPVKEALRRCGAEGVLVKPLAAEMHLSPSAVGTALRKLAGRGFAKQIGNEGLAIKWAATAKKG